VGDRIGLFVLAFAWVLVEVMRRGRFNAKGKKAASNGGGRTVFLVMKENVRRRLNKG